MVCGRLTVVLLVKPPYHIVAFRRMGVVDPVDTHSRFDYLPSSLFLTREKILSLFALWKWGHDSVLLIFSCGLWKVDSCFVG